MADATRTFRVKNFEKFQHYKDRSPPWIKLYNELLDDYAFARLPDASKAHLIAIWLLASRYENKIPADAEWVSRRINATVTVNLELLVSSGFLEPEQGCSIMLAERKQDAMPEREREREREEETDTSSLRSDVATLPKRKPKRALPENFPSQADQDWATEHWLTKGRADLCSTILDEISKFRDYHTANPKGSADWPASWRTWAKNAMNFSKANGNGNGQRRPTAHENFAVGAFLAAQDFDRKLKG